MNGSKGTISGVVFLCLIVAVAPMGFGIEAAVEREGLPNVKQARPYEPVRSATPQAGAGAGASCAADLTGDGVIDASDLLVLLGAWGPNPGHAADLNHDGIVDTADLLVLLGAWGECEFPDWQDMKYKDEPVVIDLHRVDLLASLSGYLHVDASGQGSGSIDVEYADMSSNVFNVVPLETSGSDSIVEVVTTKGTVEFDPSLGSDGLYVDGVFVSLEAVMSAFSQEMDANVDPGEASASTQAMLTLTAIAATSEWANNVAVNQTFLQHRAVAGDLLCEPNWICRSAGWVVEGVFVVGAALLCAAITGGCVLGSFATLGGISIPCALKISACALRLWQVPGAMGSLAASVACVCGPSGACCSIPSIREPLQPFLCANTNQVSCEIIGGTFGVGEVCPFTFLCDWGFCGHDGMCTSGFPFECEGTFYPGLTCPSFAACACDHLGMCDLSCP